LLRRCLLAPLHCIRDLTVGNLQKFFSFDITVQITGHVPFRV